MVNSETTLQAPHPHNFIDHIEAVSRNLPWPQILQKVGLIVNQGVGCALAMKLRLLEENMLSDRMLDTLRTNVLFVTDRVV